MSPVIQGASAGQSQLFPVFSLVRLMPACPPRSAALANGGVTLGAQLAEAEQRLESRAMARFAADLALVDRPAKAVGMATGV